RTSPMTASAGTWSARSASMFPAQQMELTMERPSYKPLAQAAIASGGCHLLDAHNPVPVRADSPALEVMTDLSKIPAATISPGDSLPEANQSMLLRGVRLLL